MTPKETVIPAGKTLGGSDRGDWVKLTQAEKAFLLVLVRGFDEPRDEQAKRRRDILLEKLK